MKFFIYTSNEEVPFEGLFFPIGSYKKVIFSNNDKQVKLFNQREGSIAKELLPDGIVDPSDQTICSLPPDDDSLFFIPLDMKDTFINKLVKGLFKTTDWTENTPQNKPSKDEIGLVGEDKLSQFYDQIETQTVLKPVTENSVEKTEAKQELLKLFNDIVSQDNEIDAVLVSTYDGNRTRVAYSSDPTPDRKVDIDAYAVQLKDLVSLLSKTQKVNPDIGLFDHVTFQYAANGNSAGGIIHVSHLSHHGDYTFLIFVSATAEGIEMLELYRNRNLSKIQELIDILLAH
ncbi:hypothetical protein [Candidatus Parabeggiatoa sp. HSG14]|uniref:hypothetical protein n=1 Tax=Candidatus Parabeggiatoa sp. HSG14 TaxID=3055593 RepID=UPI0025A7CDAB|nr:hypothetical protein [Thiotrichales bacterium HSG14]